MRHELGSQAQADLSDAAKWYEHKRPGLGGDFLAAVFEGIDAIAAHPMAWALWPDTGTMTPPIRRFPLARFPYAVAYRVFADHVYVVSIVDTRRDPKAWIR